MAALQTNHPTMSATATLSNLYVPLPLPSPKTTYDPHSRRDSSNSETRSKRTLRQLHLTRSPLSQSTGSSLIELGNTKLLVSVRGPRSVSRCSFGKEGGLVCEGELPFLFDGSTCAYVIRYEKTWVCVMCSYNAIE